jgi:hypothetical protein
MTFRTYLLIESRIGDAKTVFAKSKHSPSVFSQLVDADPTPTKKYIMWMVNRLVAGDNLSDIQQAAHVFAKNEQRLPEKDINKYSSADEIAQVVGDLGKTRSETAKEDLSGADLVFENNKCKVLKINTPKASYRLGVNGENGWCISRQHDNYFSKPEYAGKNHIYFIISKIDKTEKYAVLIGSFGFTSFWGKTNSANLGNDGFQEILHIFHIPRNIFINKPFNLQNYITGTYTTNKDGSINVKGNVNFVGLPITEFPVKFRNVSGSFCCHGCTSLTTLKGAPKSVGGYFYCNNCTSLITLDGAPEFVGGGFYCIECTSLTTLEGSLESVGGGFYCSVCTSLTTLKGAPKSVGGDFYCCGCKRKFSEEEVRQYTDVRGKIIC